MENEALIIICVLVALLIFAWYKEYITVTLPKRGEKSEEGIDVRSFARPITSQYSTTARVSGRQWS